MLDYRTLIDVSYIYRILESCTRRIADQIPGGQLKSPGHFCGIGGGVEAEGFSGRRVEQHGTRMISILYHNLIFDFMLFKKNIIAYRGALKKKLIYLLGGNFTSKGCFSKLVQDAQEWK